MRILLDTNVLIAAFISHGTCAELFEHCIQNHNLISSEFVLNELGKVLKEKFHYSEKKTISVIQLIKENAEMMKFEPLQKPICRDSDDDSILATALSGKVHCIVTGDKDLLVLHPFQKIPILLPKNFWEFEQGELANE